MSFKLLAIRPIEGCSSKFRKKLKENVLYKLYQFPEFLNQDGEVIISKNNNLTDDVVSLGKKEITNIYSSSSSIDINISCVVGKNGSGKSTLMELFFAAVYLCDYKHILKHHKLKNDNSVVIDLNMTYNQIMDENYLRWGTTEKEERIFRGLKEVNDYIFKVELYFSIDFDLYKLSINNENKENQDFFQLYELDNASNKFIKADNSNVFPFYSIALNYSIHSLNSVDYGIWIESIFHKNDAYQTPLVINPKRNEGSIDIENEKDLQKSRLLVNTLEILSKDDESDPLFNDKSISKIEFKYICNNSRTNVTGKDLVSLDQKIVDGEVDNVNLWSSYLLKNISETFRIKDYRECTWIEKEAYGYLTRKIDRIRKNYPNIFNFKDLKENLEKMRGYDSHVTFKLKQTVHFINEDNWIKKQLEELSPKKVKDQYGEGYDGFEFQSDPKKIISVINENQKLFEHIYSEKPEDSIEEESINLLPPPFIDYDIHFSEDDNDTFERLSSGEKQQIYSLHTIMYHLRNISSVKESEEIKKYRNVNLLLDEIELYFHPEMQRQFIKRLINSFSHLTKYFERNIDSINVMLATHSPFILSDIQSNDILRLVDGVPSRNYELTFGANIHNILHNDFFMENGFMGEFAKEIIQETIMYLNYYINVRDIDQIESVQEGKRKEFEVLKLKAIMSENKYISKELFYSRRGFKDYKLIINSIGEKLVRNKLIEMFNNAFNIEIDA